MGTIAQNGSRHAADAVAGIDFMNDHFHQTDTSPQVSDPWGSCGTGPWRWFSGKVDIVLLPAWNADDILSDEEEGHAEIAQVDALPNEVFGEAEVHTSDTEKNEPDDNAKKKAHSKAKKRAITIPKWKCTKNRSSMLSAAG